MEEFQIDSDFNLEDEYKSTPLVSAGNYFGNVAGVTYNPEASSIVWRVVLNDNGGYMVDGETPIDGQVFFYRNWLPKIEDKNLMTRDGKMTKRQWKINALANFAKNLGINMNTAADIKESLENGDWVGMDVKVTIGFDEYPPGNHRNVITAMVKRVDTSGLEPEDDIPF